MKAWWRVSCEEIGPTATESVLAVDARAAAVHWAEGRGGTNADAEVLVDVVAEQGDTGKTVGETQRFLVTAKIQWSARPHRGAT